MESLIGAPDCTMSDLNSSPLLQSVNHTAKENRSQMVTHLFVHIGHPEHFQLRVVVGMLRGRVCLFKFSCIYSAKCLPLAKHDDKKTLMDTVNVQH